MANQKISELTAIATIDNATDVLPIVDTSATTTKKITLTQVKTSLALNNVDNTSDVNKPVSTATQTALDAKVTGNTAITGATKTKITYDAKGLVTAGADATTADIADSLNKRYVTDAQLVVVGNTSGTNTGDNATNSQYSGLAASKQDTLVSATNIKTINSTSLLGSGDVAVQATLVSGTNIKTINSTSLLGSGDIVLSASPSGVSGAIQFSNGSAFSSDATNFFWDNTNKRLGVGTNAPSATGHFKGSGSTSATTSLLVQNSAAAKSLEVTDDQQVKGYSAAQLRFRLGYTSAGQGVSTRDGEFGIGYTDTNNSSGLRIFANGSGYSFIDGWTEGTSKGSNYPLVIGSRGNNNGPNILGITTQENGTPTIFGYAVYEASSLVTINSTTRGFLPPRMTTTQKNAIATPAAGLVVYDTTLAKLCVYTTAWETITSI